MSGVYIYIEVEREKREGVERREGGRHSHGFNLNRELNWTGPHLNRTRIETRTTKPELLVCEGREKERKKNSRCLIGMYN